MRKFMVIILAAVILMIPCGCGKTDYVSYQEQHSIDWDAEDVDCLVAIATYMGGTLEDKVYTMMVTLNRLWDDGYPDTIRDVVEDELPGVDIDGIEPDADSVEALGLVEGGYDNSGGAVEYRMGAE